MVASGNILQFIAVVGRGRQYLDSLVAPKNRIEAGKRLAEKIIAELHGKTAKFALSRSDKPLATGTKSKTQLDEEAILVLTQLQYSQKEAKDMVESAKQAKPKIVKVEDLIQEIFKNEQKTKVSI